MFGAGCGTRIVRGSCGWSSGRPSSRPQVREEARRALKGYARKTEEEVLERAKEARAALDETIDRGTRFIAEKMADVEAVVKAGRETMKEKIDKCCN